MFLTGLFSKTTWLLAFDTLFEPIIVPSLLYYVLQVILKAIVHLSLVLLPQKT